MANLARWIRESADDDDYEPCPINNLDFVRTFKLGAQGMSLAVEAGIIMGNLLDIVSRLPGMSMARYRDLCDIHNTLKDFAGDIVELLGFFFKHVEPRYWFPKGGFRQLECVVRLNAILMSEHGVRLFALSLFLF